MGIVIVFVAGLVKLHVTKRRIRRYELEEAAGLDENSEKGKHNNKKRRNKARRSRRHRVDGPEIPFGVRAIECGVQVQGIWICRPQNYCNTDAAVTTTNTDGIDNDGLLAGELGVDGLPIGMVKRSKSVGTGTYKPRGWPVYGQAIIQEAPEPDGSNQPPPVRTDILSEFPTDPTRPVPVRFYGTPPPRPFSADEQPSQSQPPPPPPSAPPRVQSPTMVATAATYTPQTAFLTAPQPIFVARSLIQQQRRRERQQRQQQKQASKQEIERD